MLGGDFTLSMNGGSSMLLSFAGVLLFLVVGFILLALTLIFSRLIQSKGKPGPDKYIPYECGEVPEGSAWIRFNIRFYVLALIFIIFDVEIIFFLPWAVVFRRLGSFAFIEGLIFIAILAIGLAYVWKKGDLEWVKPGDLEAMKE
jgi:NADH:ubiquinone oxidoreductase subunit 3 (subunit A)